MGAALLRVRRDPVLLALPALALLLCVQYGLERTAFPTKTGWPWTTWLLIAAGGVVGIGAWWRCVCHNPPARDQLGALQPSPLGMLHWRLGLSGVAFLFAIITWRNIHGNQFSIHNVLPWLGAVAIWMLAWWPWEREFVDSPTPAERTKRRIAALVVVLITALGAWLRFHRLDTMPYEMTQDHSWKLLDIKTILDGERPIFFPNNTGREPWQFYYVALVMRVFNLPLEFIALKVANGIIGTITIPLLYVFGREVGGRKLGVFAALLYAIGKWPISTTRMGLRFPYATLPAVLILLHLWRYVKHGKRTDALLTAFWMGFGLYGYIGIRVLPLVIALVLVGVLIDRRRKHQRLNVIGHGVLIAVTTALIFLPLGHFMLERPDQFWYRIATRTSDRERSIETSICTDKTTGVTINPTLCKVGIFGDNTWRALAAFNWRGDRSEVNHVSHDPFFDLVSAALLLAGLPVLAWRLFRERSLRWRLLILALPLLLLTTTLSIAFPVENPSTSRTGVVMPVIFVITAAPLALLADWLVGWLPIGEWRQVARRRLALGALVLTALFGFAFQQNYVRYFRDLDRQYRGFVTNTIEIADLIDGYANRGITPENTYIMGWAHWFEGRNLGVHLGNLHWHETHIINKDQPLPLPKPNEPILYLFHQEDEFRRTELTRRFPKGKLTLFKASIERKSFYTFYVPGGS